jgi:hypothetical protein
MRRKALWGSYVSDSVKSPDNRLDFIVRAFGSGSATFGAAPYGDTDPYVAAFMKDSRALSP